jgi:PTS system nitrogen regulatory IIA component
MTDNSDPSVRISYLLKPKRVIIVKNNIKKESLIGKLISLITKEHTELERDFILEKVLQREQGISTTLDTGLSIPHARIDEIEDFMVSLALSPDGLSEVSGQPASIKAMFLFLSPSDSKFFQKHLKLLSLLSSTFQPEFIEKLCSLKTPTRIIKEIAATEI